MREKACTCALNPRPQPVPLLPRALARSHKRIPLLASSAIWYVDVVHTDEPGERRAGGAVSAGSRPDDVPRPGENHPPRVLPAGVRRFAQDVWPWLHSWFALAKRV